MLLDVNDINKPMVENTVNDTIISVQESIVKERQGEAVNSVQYVVDEDLATVLGLSDQLFPATVVSRNDKNPVVGGVNLGFVVGKIVGPIQPEGSGSVFFYQEDGDFLPVKYVVQEDINTIEASL